MVENERLLTAGVVKNGVSTTTFATSSVDDFTTPNEISVFEIECAIWYDISLGELRLTFALVEGPWRELNRSHHVFRNEERST